MTDKPKAPTPTPTPKPATSPQTVHQTHGGPQVPRRAPAPKPAPAPHAEAPQAPQSMWQGGPETLPRDGSTILVWSQEQGALLVRWSQDHWQVMANGRDVAHVKSYGTIFSEPEVNEALLRAWCRPMAP